MSREPFRNDPCVAPEATSSALPPAPPPLNYHRLLLTLLDNLPGMAYRCRNDPDWTMEFVSEGCRELTGYAPEELIGNRATAYGALIHPDDRPRVYADAQRALARGEPFEYTYRIRRADGQWRWVWERGRGVFRDDGSADALEGFISDVTDRVQAEAALRAERDRASRYLAIAGVILVVLNADGTVALINRRGCEILGLPESEIVGQPWFERFIPSAERPLVEAAFCRLIAGDLSGAEYFENRILTGRGERLIAWHNTVLHDDQGRVTGTLSSGEDITDQRQTEQQIAQTKAMLEKAQRLETIGRLAGGVAHDFNNLLTAILGHAELGLNAAQAGPYNPLLEESLKQIERSAQRAAALTRQLLAFGRRQVSQPTDVDLATLIRNAEPMLRRLLTENITLSVRILPGVHVVRADEAQLEQVLLNLVVNARDALGNGGNLTIVLERELLDRPDPSEHGALSPGPYVCLSVTDTGCGMDAATLERVFEPFFTTKEFGRGTGLGLATVHGIVRQFGGHIAVRSTLGEGSTFRVWLPAATASPPAPATVAPHASATFGDETILLCEDDQTVRSLTADFLRSAGYRVLEAAGGEEARRLAAALTTPPHLLLTDVILPDRNGRQLALELAARWPALRVLYVSGYPADVIAHHGVLAPGVEFLEKPYSRPRLLARVREVLDRTRPPTAVSASLGPTRASALGAG